MILLMLLIIFDLQAPQPAQLSAFQQPAFPSLLADL